MSVFADKECFENRLFKGFLIPGVAVGALMILMLCVQPWISTDLLRHPVGGPKGMAIGFALLPFGILFVTYALTSIFYAVLLLVKYLRHSDSFVKSARRFVLFSDTFLIVMDVMLVLAFIEVWRWNFFSSLNLPIVVFLTALAFIMTVFFICWTKRIYQYVGHRFFSRKTFGALALILFLLFLAILLPCMCWLIL